MIGSDTIVVFLKTVRADDCSEIVQDCFDVMDSYNIEDYMSGIELAYMFDSEISDEDRAQSVLDCVTSQMREVLTAQGFALSDGVSLRDLCTLARAVGDIIYYEDHGTLRDICLQPSSALERISEMIALVSSLSVERCLELITAVGDNSIDQILDLLVVNETPIQINEIYPQMYAQYEGWMHRQEAAATSIPFAQRYIDVPVSCGFDFKMYLDVFLAEHKIEADPNEAQVTELARELISLAMVAKDSYKNILLSIKPIIPTIYSDVKYATMLNHAVTRLTLEFQKKPI